MAEARPTGRPPIRRPRAQIRATVARPQAAAGSRTIHSSRRPVTIISPAIIQRGSGGFSRRGRPWISATSQWPRSTVSIASADARCSRLPQTLTEPRQPRKITAASTPTRTSGHPRRHAGRTSAVSESVGIPALLRSDPFRRIRAHRLPVEDAAS